MDSTMIYFLELFYAVQRKKLITNLSYIFVIERIQPTGKYIIDIPHIQTVCTRKFEKEIWCKGII
jgi:hypothetical protein